MIELKEEQKKQGELNKLIAEFMELEKSDVNEYHVKINGFWQYNTGVWFMKYHSSWDWLMPVIQKIRNIVIGIPLMSYNGLIEGDINRMYKEVIKCITIYNEVRK